MFNIDPLSQPVAIAEILFLLILAAFVGWGLARLIFNDRVNTLLIQLSEKESELEDCRRAKVASPKKKGAAVTPPQEMGQLAPSGKSLAAHDSTQSAYATQEPGEPVSIPITSEAAVLSRIAQRISELNFDRIGWATPAEADDLKDIVGVGPLLERKLHSLGIYTFRQIANFTKEDMVKVNEIIEFFPGRIERDNWVGQAKIIYERKYGSKV